MKHLAPLRFVVALVLLLLCGHGALAADVLEFTAATRADEPLASLLARNAAFTTEVPTSFAHERSYWIHVPKAAHEQVVVMYETTEIATLFARSAQGAPYELMSGTSIPVHRKPVQAPGAVFRIPPGHDAYVRFTLSNQPAMISLVSAEQYEADTQARTRHDMFVFFMVGVSLAVGFYAIAQYFLSGNRDGIAYAVYMLALIADEFIYADGLGWRVLWPDGTIPLFWAQIGIMPLIVSSLFWFVREFLETWRTPAIDRFVIGVPIVFTLIALTLSFLQLDYASAAFLFWAFPLCQLIIIGLGASFLRRGERAGLFLLLAVVMFFIGSTFSSAVQFCANLLHSVPSSGPIEAFVKFGTDYFWEIGAALESLLLSMAIADRLRIAYLEREKAQAQLRDYADGLETIVAERTRSLASTNANLTTALEQLENVSLTDPLTGLRNRRFLDRNLPADIPISVRRYQEWADHLGEPMPLEADLTFFLIDLDHFKMVNDTYGHAAGDAVLVQMRERLMEVVRESDYLVRWGGEEFLVVARGTNRQQARYFAERLRTVVCDRPFVLDDGTLLTKSCSIGFAAFPFFTGEPAAVTWEAVVAIADHGLYVGKRNGRNMWVGLEPTVAQPPETYQAGLQLEDAIAAGFIRVVFDRHVEQESAMVGSAAVAGGSA